MMKQNAKTHLKQLLHAPSILPRTQGMQNSVETTLLSATCACGYEKTLLSAVFSNRVWGKYNAQFFNPNPLWNHRINTTSLIHNY